MSLALNLLRTDHEVPFPQCRYPVQVLWPEILAQTTIRCPCCRRRVRLVDANGSIQNLGADIDAQLSQIFGGLSEHEGPVVAQIRERLVRLVAEGRDMLLDHGLWRRTDRDAWKKVVAYAGGQ